MFVDDLLSYRQSQPGSLASFGAEEPGVKFLLYFFLHSDTVIFYLKFHPPTLWTFRLNCDGPLSTHDPFKGAGIDAPTMLLRLPPLSRVGAVVESVDVSLNSELSVLAALSEAAVRRGRTHDVVLMVELGDLREGVMPEELIAVVRQALQFEGIRMKGLGTNLACFGGIVPTEENMNRLVQLVDELEQRLGLALECISGINSSGLELINSGRMPQRINHARIGEAILLGRETTRRKPWPNTYHDAFVLHAEILELKRKPSLPQGERGEDAFGKQRDFEDQGDMHRALLDIGRQDIDIEGLTPCDSRLRIIGASSGYLIVDASHAIGDTGVGDTPSFSLNYSALATAMTSQLIEKRTQRGGARAEESHDA